MPRRIPRNLVFEGLAIERCSNGLAAKVIINELLRLRANIQKGAEKREKKRVEKYNMPISEMDESQNVGA